jgi:hypothetical protein
MVRSAVQVGQSDGGNHENRDDHDPVKIQKQSSIEAEHFFSFEF